MRELVAFIDLHLELVARELYPKAFFGGTISEGNAARVRKLLDAQHRRASSAWRASRPSSPAPTFTQADCAAWASLPVVAMATQAVYGEDLLVAGRHRLEGLPAAPSASGRARRRSPPTARPRRNVPPAKG